MARAYYLFVSVVAGAAVLALEVLAARVMAPALGSGPVTWSALLAVALGMLAIGNLAGGFLSKRVTAWGTIAWSLAVASACLVLLSRFHVPAMRWSADQPLLLGAIVAAFITQAVPVGMLGVVTPVILHKAQNPMGRWAGFVLAAGSSGGIAGALLTGLVLLPRLGLTRSYLVVAGLLVVAAAPAVWPQRRWLAAVCLLASVVLIGACWRRPPSNTVIQSRYGQIEVIKNDLGCVLMIDGLPQTGIPAEIHPGDGLRHGYLLELAISPRPESTRALVIGLGAGLAPRLLAVHGVDCDTVEIDPQVVQLAKAECGFTGNVTVADGRAFLSRDTRKYDIIFLDVCTSDRLAWHLFTVEAMQTVSDRLVPGGVLAIQFIGDDGPWSASLERTVEAVFGRCLMLASMHDLGPIGPRWLFAMHGGLPPFPPPMSSSENGPPWRTIVLRDHGNLLKDDHFPTEWAWARTAVAWRSRYRDLTSQAD